MTTTLKYTGTAPIWGTTIVGKPDRWYPGQMQDVSDADAALYLAAGGFQVVAPASVSGGGIGGPSTGVRPKAYLNFSGAVENVAQSAVIWNFAQCINIPVKYVAVRIGYTVLGGGGGIDSLKMLVGASDDIGDRTLVNTANSRKWVSPWRGGAEQNAVSATGWRQATWGGASSTAIADPGASLTSTTFTDVIQIDGIADSLNPGYYPLLLRVQPGSVANTNFTRVGQSVGVSNASLYGVDAGPNLFYSAARTTVGDAVGTPSNWGNALSLGTLGDLQMMPVVVEAWSADGVRSVLFAGDSRFAQASGDIGATRGYLCTSFLVQRAFRASGKKVAIESCAMGGTTGTFYGGRAKTLLAQQKPSVLVYLGNSINNNAGAVATAAILSADKLRTLELIDLCNTQGTQLLLMDIWPHVGGFGANLSVIQEFSAWCRTLGVPFISPWELYGTAAGEWGGTPTWNDGLTADHGSTACYTDLAGRIQDKILPMIA